MKRFIIYFLYFIFLYNYIYCDSIIEDGQQVAGTWDLSGSPYIVQGMAIIPEGEELFIQPGVQVLFGASIFTDSNHAKYAFNYEPGNMQVGVLWIEGRIEAIGTAEMPITFTRYGEAGYWGVIANYFNDGTSRLKYCNISYMNKITGLEIPNSEQVYLAGLAFYEGNAVVEYCNVFNCKHLYVHSLDSFVSFGYNQAWSDGDIIPGGLTFCGLYNGNCQYDIFNNEIHNVELGIMLYNAYGSIYNNVVYGCQKGIEINEIHYQDAVLYNNLIYNCSRYGLLSLTGAHAYSFNNTIVNNTAGICLMESGNLIVKNTILSGNESDFYFDYSNNLCQIGNSRHSSPEYHNQLIDLGNNIYSDPQLINPSQQDFHFLIDSPCIDSGTDELGSYELPQYDLDGNSRTSESAVDMGCYEYQRADGWPWEVVQGMENNMIVFGSAFIGDVSMAEGNMIGAFGPGGVEDCRAISEVNENGEYYMTILGNDAGEEIRFRIWMVESEMVRYSGQIVDFEPEAIYENYHLNFDIYNIEIELEYGWNWVSLNVEPISTDPCDVFGSILNNVIQVKSQTQSLTMIDNELVGDLDLIENGKMYKINMNAPGTLTLRGEDIPSEEPIELNPVWNWVAYYPQEPLAVGSALASVWDNIYQVKSQYQSGVIILDEYIGELEEMVPYEGYKIYVDTSSVLIYPGEEDSSLLNRSNRDFTPGYEHNMVVFGDAIHFAGLIIEVRDEEGYLRGEAQITEDGFFYMTICGNESGEELTLMVGDEQFITTITFEQDITIVDFDLGADNDYYMSRKANKLTVYPNPFNPETVISFELASEEYCNLTVFNIKGQLMETIINEKLASGQHSVIWDGAGYASGIYFVRLSYGETSEIKKIVLMK